MREDQVRDGQTVVSLWENVLMTERNKLGDECTVTVLCTYISTTTSSNPNFNNNSIMTTQSKHRKHHQKCLFVFRRGVGEDVHVQIKHPPPPPHRLF